jgi:acyl-[acyl carrier protein]--UDP-N-acetylglucosamine O-acyltransferase
VLLAAYAIIAVDHIIGDDVLTTGLKGVLRLCRITRYAIIGR